MHWLSEVGVRRFSPSLDAVWTLLTGCSKVQAELLSLKLPAKGRLIATSQEPPGVSPGDLRDLGRSRACEGEWSSCLMESSAAASSGHCPGAGNAASGPSLFTLYFILHTSYFIMTPRVGPRSLLYTLYFILHTDAASGPSLRARAATGLWGEANLAPREASSEWGQRVGPAGEGPTPV